MRIEICSMEQARENVVRCEAWVLREDLVKRGIVCEEVEDQPHGEPAVSDAWLPDHDPRIANDAATQFLIPV